MCLQIRLFYISIILLNAIACVSQSPNSNLDKYWEYRNRFLGDQEKGIGGFIWVGDGPGESLPISGKAPLENCEKDWWMLQSDCKMQKGMGKLDWGDGTTHLGMYISILATEYRLLKDAGQNVEQTSKELHHALNAFERLDANAEVLLGGKPELNGFFLRDDVPDYFFEDKKGNKRFPMNSNSAYSCISSDYSCSPGIDDGSFVSQDQAIYMLFAFNLVKELIPEERYKPGSKTFGSRVELFTHRIVNYMRENNWKLCSPLEKKSKISNRWGGDCRAFAWPIAKSANRITDGKYLKNYQKGRSKGLSAVIFSAFDWLNGVQGKNNMGMVLQLVTMSDTWSPRKVSSYSRNADLEVYALAYSIINKEKLAKPLTKSHFDKMINLAPIDGPCFNVPDCNAPDGWKANNRWIHPSHVNGNKYGHNQYYPGLDYMFLYNLYHLYYKEGLPKYIGNKQWKSRMN